MESYRRLCTQFYEADKPHPPTETLEFYLRHCTRARGAVLEPMCGSGRFLVPILERGIDIDGVDGSSAMLEACRLRCRDKELSPNLFEQSIEQMSLPRQYRLVIVPASSFCLLTTLQQIQDGMRSIHSAMLPGATLVMEIDLHMHRASQSWPWSGRWVDLPDRGKIIVSTLAEYSAHDRIMRSVNRYDLMKDGRLCETEMEEFNVRFHDRDEFRALLDGAGFTMIRCLKPYSGNDADDTDESVVFECQKPVSA